MDTALLIQTIVNSVAAGSVYAVIAVGLAMAFGVMKMANFAHGEFFMAGAYGRSASPESFLGHAPAKEIVL